MRAIKAKWIAAFVFVEVLLLVSVVVLLSNRDQQPSAVGSGRVNQIKTDSAPAAIGPYSQAVVVNGFLYSAGQIALDPATGQMVEGGVEAQTERVMKNLAAVLEAADLSWKDVVKTTVYLHDMADFPKVNEIYGRWIGDARPARSTVQVTALPRGGLVEIDIVAAASR